MSLKEYNKKRNFKNTHEPKGVVQKKSSENRFVVQYHEARAKHFDFRIEHNGVLVSWAVPKGFSYSLSDKRLAVKVEDHPIDYIDFEGIIPKGNYGAGTVQIFDKGVYSSIGDLDFGLKKGHIKFVLFGEKLKGGWSLFKIDEKNWLLTKLKDEFVGKPAPKIDTFKNPFKTCKVQLATLCETIPKGKNWLFEIKYDGYRVVAYAEYGKVKLESRNGVDYTKKFEKVTNSLKEISVKHSFVLDGEMVAFDDGGRSDFGLLQERIKSNSNQIFYVVFDILAFQGEDLRSRPLFERKEILNNLPFQGNLILSSFVESKGQESFSLAKKNNLEGIVAKQKNSTYNGTRDDTWLKIKCRHRQEFVVLGFSMTDKNPELSALILGYYKDKKLVFVGKVGTGFDNKKRGELHKILSKLQTKSVKILNLPKFKESVVFVKPVLVAEIEFQELTKDKILRQPSFIALREDKDAKDVKLEVASES